MKLTSSSSWSDRRNALDQDNISTETISLDAFVVGLIGFLVGSVFYAGAIIAVTRILKWQDIVSFDLSWGASILLGLLYVFVRSVDKAFFHTRIL